MALLALPGLAQAEEVPDVWADYLDFAYVYASADGEPLRERLAEYGTEAGRSLERYLDEHLETLAPLHSDDHETATRRRAIASLLLYLARGDAAELARGREAIESLDDRLERHENRFWYHLIRAHASLEHGHRRDFVREVLALWLHVVVPLEGPYETLDRLSLEGTPNSGFVAALPHLHEVVARLILLRSQALGIDRDLDPLAAIVRALADGRIGAYPEVVPPEASSRAYLERIVARLDGPESDDGSLTFTLVLFEATRLHAVASARLADEGLSPSTLEAIRVATGAYRTALRRADTPQGRAAVYTRVLRQIGEIHAAKQRLGSDVVTPQPLGIEGAIEVFESLAPGLRDGRWRELGFRDHGPRAFQEALRALWYEIQEASLNVGTYYLDRSVALPHRADELSRSAARVFSRYLAFFREMAARAGGQAVPDAAYFGAFEAARGIGDALLVYAPTATPAEVMRATGHYRGALTLFPFERELWSELTTALARHGREAEYVALVSGVADRVARSRAVAAWIDAGEPESEIISTLRRALSDELVLLYLGFADADAVERLENELADLQVERGELGARLERLRARRDALTADVPAAPADEPDPADDGISSIDPDPDEAGLDLREVARQLELEERRISRLHERIVARSRALPLYRQALETESLAEKLRGRRDHPLHGLLRRMYHEEQS